MLGLTITRLELESYKAFREPTHIDLAPITVILGKNSSGKSALSRSLIFAAQTFLRQERPFALSIDGLIFGSSLTDITHEQVPTGFRLGLRWRGDIAWTIASRSESQPPYQQIVVNARLSDNNGTLFDLHGCAWSDLRDRLNADSRFENWARRVQHLGDVRRVEDRTRELFDAVRVGPSGIHTGIVLAADKAHLARVNSWFTQHLSPSQIVVDHRDDELRIGVAANSSQPVPLSQVGAGITQVLPIVTLLTSELDAGDTVVIEHPELHLHPFAHAGVAELLIATARAQSAPRIVLESHSDLIVWRLRRALAERRLEPDQVAVWYVADNGVRLIALDDRGTPDWWPTEVFGELHGEVQAIRVALAKRGRP